MPNYRIPYVSEPYRAPQTRIPDLLMRQGLIEAERARASGDIWANAIQQVGGIVGGTLQQYGEKRAAEQKAAKIAKNDEAFLKLVQSGAPPEEIAKGAFKIYDPERAAKVAAGVMAYPEFKRKQDEAATATRERALKHLPALAGGLEGSGTAAPWLYPAARQAVIDAGLVASDKISPDYTPEMADVIGKIAQQFRPPGEDYTLGPGQKRFKPGGKVEAEVGFKPEEAKPDTRSLDVQAAEALKAGDMARYNELKRVRREFATLDDKPQAKEWVQRGSEILHLSPSEIKAGDKPYSKAPQTQRLTKDERQDMASWSYALPKLDSFTAYVEKNPDKWGKFDSFVQELKQALPGLGDTEYASQNAFIGRVNAEIKHAIYGAALTEGEKEDSKQFLISKDMQPIEIVAKVKEAAARARANMNYYRELGFNIPEGAGTPTVGKKYLSTDPNAVEWK